MTAWMELESVMLSEISKVMRDKYHMISPLTGTQSTKEKIKHNITRDIEIKNNLTVTRGEVGGDNGAKCFQETLQRTHGQNQGGGVKARDKVGLAGLVGSGGG